ncbi:MAG TPA: zf-HC2 domain-containing protein [Longimicrobiales bacterium]|nr:zf-HC2 domain-containing protein [Longimicrobiales bacterium]
MHDPWLEKISDSIDGLLEPAGEQALQDHLAGCAECRTLQAELRDVVAAARSAADTPPSSDLWAGIAAGIRELDPNAMPTAPDRLEMLSPVAPLKPRRSPARARRFSFSAPQLAAAAVVLMTLSGAAVWFGALARPDGSTVATGTIIQSSGSGPRAVRPVGLTAASADYAEDVATLEQALEDNRAQLDPSTIEVIERSLESIDRAIEDARTALAADPGNPYLHRQLDNTMRKKIDVLQRAAGVQRAQS